MRYFRKYIKYFLITVFPAICWLFLNNAINRHFHQLHSGQVIMHSHPYQKEDIDKSPFKSHHHSDFELFILDIISNPVFLTVTFYSLALLLVLIEKFTELPIHIWPYPEPYTLQNYRGPPALI
jgi:hypothetical protein